MRTNDNHPALPIDPMLPRLLEQLGERSSLVLRAEPGAGKSTRLPRAILESGMVGSKEVLVLQPRRLAARLLARRVSDELGEALGGLVGYQVRFEEAGSARTKLRFLTEGVLQQRLLMGGGRAEASMERVGAVVLDEFHERHLEGDLSLALLKRLRRSRPDLKLVVMSATLDPEPLVAFLEGAHSAELKGRRFEVAIEHQNVVDARPLEQQVASAVRRLLAEGEREEGTLSPEGGRNGRAGAILVFLPGAAEIRRASEALRPLAQSHDLSVLPLHGELSPAEQDLAVRPSAKRRVILSTNIAESSVSLEGVVAVVDSGLARVAAHSAWTGLSTLSLAKISKASAIQRAGRAGRMSAGRCLRLYSRHDFDARPERDLPEIERHELSQMVLGMRAAGFEPAIFDWLEPPPGEALAAAIELLTLLGALDGTGALTELGRRMARMPLHPRQARLVLEAAQRRAGRDGALLAALMGERELRLYARGGGAGLSGQGARDERARVTGPSDLLDAHALFREAERRGFSARALASLELDAGVANRVAKVAHTVERMVSEGKGSEDGAASPALDEVGRERALLLSTLAALPDRVGRRRRGEDGRLTPEVLLAKGGSARLSEGSVLFHGGSELLVAVEAGARGLGARREVTIRSASALEPEWLLDLFPEALKEERRATWNIKSERAEGLSRLLYGELAIEESRVRDVEGLSELLFEQASPLGLGAFVEAGPGGSNKLEPLLERLRFIRSIRPQELWAEFGEEAQRALLRRACEGLRSFQELREVGLLELALNELAPAQRSLLERLAPEGLRLPGGRRVAIHYEAGKPPWIESRLQDFFGLAEGPKVAGGEVALVLHLLAPNGRAVQVTSDLSGFWSRHYPAIRRELCRRYPRHSWPEDPLHAEPPKPKPRIGEGRR